MSRSMRIKGTLEVDCPLCDCTTRRATAGFLGGLCLLSILALCDLSPNALLRSDPCIQHNYPIVFRIDVACFRDGCNGVSVQCQSVSGCRCDVRRDRRYLLPCACGASPALRLSKKYQCQSIVAPKSQQQCMKWHNRRTDREQYHFQH